MPPHAHSFLELTDWDREQIERVIEIAVRLKQEQRRRRGPLPLRRHHLALLFQKPSLRTRLSFEAGFAQLGGTATFLGPAEVGMGEREPVADIARVAGRYVDLIVARVFAHAMVAELARHSPAPVINGLSDHSHPCQIMADLLTVREQRGSLENLSVAWVGDGNNVATSWLNAARRLPIRVTLACPEGYDPDPDVFAKAREEAGDRVQLVRDPPAAVAGADVVYADTWYSMGQEEEKVRRQAAFTGYTIDRALMAEAGADAIFLHCLPAHRGDEVTEEVLEGPRSRVFEQAENRLHAQKAIMLSLLALESAVI